MLSKYLWPLRYPIFTGLLLKIGGALSELLLPYIMAHIIDVVVPRGEIPPIYFWGLMMLLAALGALLGNIWANRRSARVASDAIRKIRYDLFSKTLSLSVSQIKEIGEASLESRLTSDTYHVHNMISRLQRIGIRAPILLAGGLLMTFLLDWQLALILTALLPFIAGLTIWVAKRGRPKYMRQQQAIDGLVQKVRETVSGIRVIKSLVTGEREKRSFSGTNERVVELEKDAAYNMALTNPIMTFLMNSGLTLVIVAGAFLINTGRSEYGSIVAFLTYFTIITNSMLAITRIFTIQNRGMASADRIAEVLNTDVDQNWVRDTDGSRVDVENEEVPHIEFRHVSFTFSDGSKPVIKDLSFKLKHGETLGVLGETGSGKSTVIDLCMRLYDAGEGEIYINGRDIRDIPRDRLYQLFGFSLQNDFLYGDTIRANIDFGRDLDDAAIDKAAAQAQAAEFIREKDRGMQTQLSSHASNLSGGQKQRLLISRALAGNPDILIMDDSSSALDYRTDAELRRVLREEFRHTTKIIVAQRISSVRTAEQILVLKDGEIQAAGRHEELLESSSAYQEIAAVQMGILSKSNEERKEELEKLLHQFDPRKDYNEEAGDYYG